MIAPEPRIPYTYEDYRTLPEDMSRRYELLHGELYMVPAPSTRHQRILGNLHLRLRTHADSHRLGEVLLAPVDVILGQGSGREVAQPDIIFIAHARRDIIKLHGIEGAPDLVIEILSAGTAERDRGYKRTLYARYRVPEYWIVDPDARTVEVYVTSGEGLADPTTFPADAALTSALFTGLAIPLAGILAD
jgi:Uma2 family endonuclease